jgi:hypothetical protein
MTARAASRARWHGPAPWARLSCSKTSGFWSPLVCGIRHAPQRGLHGRQGERQQAPASLGVLVERPRSSLRRQEHGRWSVRGAVRLPAPARSPPARRRKRSGCSAGSLYKHAHAASCEHGRPRWQQAARPPACAPRNWAPAGDAPAATRAHGSARRPAASSAAGPGARCPATRRRARPPRARPAPRKCSDARAFRRRPRPGCRPGCCACRRPGLRASPGSAGADASLAHVWLRAAGTRGAAPARRASFRGRTSSARRRDVHCSSAYRWRMARMRSFPGTRMHTAWTQVAQQAAALARGAVRDAPLACGARRRPELRRPHGRGSAPERRAGARRAACMRVPRLRSDHADSMPRTEGEPVVASAPTRSAGAGGWRRCAASRAGDAPWSQPWAADRAPRTGLPQLQAAQQQRGHAAGQQGLQPPLHLWLDPLRALLERLSVRPGRALDAMHSRPPEHGLPSGAACGPRAGAPQRERFQRRGGRPACRALTGAHRGRPAAPAP